MIGFSKNKPTLFGSRNGKVLLRFNVQKTQVQTEDGVEEQYRFEQQEFDSAPDRSMDGVKFLLKAVTARKRWEAETAGVKWDGHFIHTDRESQSKIQVAYITASDGIRQDPSTWKVGSGFISLSNADAIQMAMAVLSHVQACFDSEADFNSLIDACATEDELMALDINF